MTARPTTHPTELMDEVAASASERMSAGNIDFGLAFAAGCRADVSSDEFVPRTRPGPTRKVSRFA